MNLVIVPLKASMLCNAEYNKDVKRYSDQQLTAERAFLSSLCRAHKELYCVCSYCAQATFLSHENWLLDLIL